MLMIVTIILLLPITSISDAVSLCCQDVYEFTIELRDQTFAAFTEKGAGSGAGTITSLSDSE